MATGIVSDPAAFVRGVCNYPSQKTKLFSFLTTFETSVETQAVFERGKTGGKIGAKTIPTKPVQKYLDRIVRSACFAVMWMKKEIGKGNSDVLEISSDDVLDFFGYDENGRYSGKMGKDEEGSVQMINTILCNTDRAIRLLYELVEEIKQEYCESTSASTMKSRVEAKINSSTQLPAMSKCPYEIRLIPPLKRVEPVPIHEIRAYHVGGLQLVEGIVSKVSSVKPRLVIAVYRCSECAEISVLHVESQTFMPAKDCSSATCSSARKRGTLVFSSRDSRFSKRQEAKIQELPALVPAGSVPRQLKIILTGELTRKLKPGMGVRLGGVFTPVIDGGWSAPGREREHAYLNVHWLEPLVEQEVLEGVTESCSKDDLKKKVDILLKKHAGHDLYHLMAESLAPAIHGLADVKKTLLLQLVGGTSKTDSKEGFSVRGRLHVLLMGDPGISKSQLLLRVCAAAPRAHFTCGKGASGVGLTASVVRDPVTNEFALEGGAIVLADQGICCVDEFDKMTESDRTAIHEVMEQQTVSISKAGLLATLNARTTILAAANPIYGRYNRAVSAIQNIGLPAALLSRFDVVFLLLDDSGNYDRDLNLAKHLLKVHKEKRVDAIPLGTDVSVAPLSTDELRLLIAYAQHFNPKLSQKMADVVSEKYVEMRVCERMQRESLEECAYVTPRSLFALLRLSQARARLRFSETIEQQDFDEAVRILNASKASLSACARGAGGAVAAASSISDVQSRVMSLIRRLTDEIMGQDEHGPAWVDFGSACHSAETEGIDPDQLERTIDELCHSGTLAWSGITKKKFRMLLID